MKRGTQSTFPYNWPNYTRSPCSAEHLSRQPCNLRQNRKNKTPTDQPRQDSEIRTGHKGQGADDKIEQQCLHTCCWALVAASTDLADEGGFSSSSTACHLHLFHAREGDIIDCTETSRTIHQDDTIWPNSNFHHGWLLALQNRGAFSTSSGTPSLTSARVQLSRLLTVIGGARRALNSVPSE